MKILFIDGGAGASGDMILAALLDLTGGRAVLEEGLAKLKVPGWRLMYPPRRRGGVEAIGVEVILSAEAPHFPNVRTVAGVLARSGLSPFVRNYAAATFAKMAEAEERAHRVAAGHHGFHEVGGVDALIDVVGTFTLLEAVGADRVMCSPLRLGFGFVEGAHGTLPIPAPATAELVRDVPTYAGNIEGEFTTPTGAALVATVAERFGTMPELKIKATGYGPGKADPPGVVNVLRVVLGEAAALDAAAGVGEDKIAVLEANIDDMTAEELSYAVTALTTAGALDITITPVLMKKGRPAHLLTVLGQAEDRERLAALILDQTTTLGVRYYEAARKTLSRRVVTVATEYGTGKVKVAGGAGHKVRVHAEYESAAALAERAGVPIRDVARALENAAREQIGNRTENKAGGARAGAGVKGQTEPPP